MAKARRTRRSEEEILDDSLAKVEDDITKTQARLQSLKEKKEELLKKQKELQYEKIRQAIEKSGKTVDEFLKDSGISDNSDEAGSNDSAE
jgi:ElaB/YqjD/DUF883 family membrane-anchored ribosome-binding protein